MNKQELVDEIAKDSGLTKVDAQKGLDAFIGVVTKTLKGGGNIKLSGFITAKVVDRPARTGRNPQTGADIEIPAKKIVKVGVGQTLKDAVQ